MGVRSGFCVTEANGSVREVRKMSQVQEWPPPGSLLGFLRSLPDAFLAQPVRSYYTLATSKCESQEGWAASDSSL